MVKSYSAINARLAGKTLNLMIWVNFNGHPLRSTLNLFRGSARSLIYKIMIWSKVALAKSTGNKSIDTAISKYAKKYSVNANLIYAVMQAESSFNPNASNSVSGGHYGLMQVSKALLRESGVEYGWQDPDTNAMVGTKYLSSLLKQYGNDVEKALAAYNWGPGNVNSCIKKYGNKWKNNLPSETKNYLVKILKTYTGS